MSILELPKDALLSLTDIQLEHLIGRLAEAEVVAHGASVADVRFSGSITAPDGGVDVRVDVKIAPFESGFMPKPNTIFQSKRHSMLPGEISREMKPKGILSAAIGAQCERGGAYIIVSLGDDCTEPMRNARLQAMKNAVADHPAKDEIHLDFYDRFNLHQWLRQHPSIMIWVRTILGQPLSGWQAYGSWSNVPIGMTDELITAPGVSVILPKQNHQKLTIEQAITPTRQLICASNKAIRIAGLSGVGKTRFVQALFDETVGEDALDRTSVVYVDTGADPIPSARQLIDQFIQDGRAVTIVIDNCQPALHADLASRITSSENRIKLITVEYDIRDDKPQTTEVVHIEADGPEIAEALVLRRYPQIGQANARRVATFAGGNTRVALAVADGVSDGESLAQLSNTNLFDRLFRQRHDEDGRLREHAEVLSLLYSFAVESVKDEPNELAMLGALCGATDNALFRSAQLLLDRQIAQKRGRWRAILPHAIANNLAGSALNGMSISTLRSTFEKSANRRLLTSFAHRLGLMHDHPIAQQIVKAWLSDGGMLVPITGLNDEKARILDYVAPVCPDVLLDRIEAEVIAPEFDGLTPRNNPRRDTILKILVSLAYEPQAFDRCVNLLIRIAQDEDLANNHDPVGGKIIRFFQPYLSGTHATLDQRAAILRAALWSKTPHHAALGVRMLATTLDGSGWSGSNMGDFGARPRDFGYQPNKADFLAWRKFFIAIAVETGLDDDPMLSRHAREALAQEFRGLWHHAAFRECLIEAVTKLNEQRIWTEGWKAVNSTIYFDYRRKTADVPAKQVPAELSALRDLLTPKDLVSKLKTYLFGERHDLWSLDLDIDLEDPSKYEKARVRVANVVAGLSERFGQSNLLLSVLGPELFSTNWMPCGYAFGAGFAKGSEDIRAKWAELVEVLHLSGITNFNSAVLSGFIHEVGRTHQGLDREILDQCAKDTVLQPFIVFLHPTTDFDDADLDRCMKVLEHVAVGASTFGTLLWDRSFAGLPRNKILRLAHMILQKPHGDRILMDALNMKLHDADKTIDILGTDLRRLGLVAAISRLGGGRDGYSSMVDYNMAAVIASCLAFEGNEAEKSAWLDAVFSSLDVHYGHSNGFEETIHVTASTLPEQFLDRVFSGDNKQQQPRLHILEHGGHKQSIFATTDVRRLVAWCQGRSDPVVWAGVAAALDVFHASADEKTYALTNKCIQFLTASPNPEQVLQVFASQMTTEVWTGSRANMLERKTDALAALADHEIFEISEAAKRVEVEARSWVSRERERERVEDEANEQTFE